MSSYDSWKTTEPEYYGDARSERAKCEYEFQGRERRRKHPKLYCDIPYEDHNDEEVGHAFVMPERDDERDY